MAAKDPSAIEAIDTNVRICRQSLVMPGNAVKATRTRTAIAAILGAEAKKVVTGVGAPSYTSGVHIWNGTAEILNASPASRNTRPNRTPMLRWSRTAAATSLKDTEPQ